MILERSDLTAPLFSPRGPDFSLGSVTTVGSLNLAASRLYDFRAQDDGGTVWFWMREVGNPSNAAAGWAPVTSDTSGTDHAIFYNRERTGSNHVAYLDNVQVSTNRQDLAELFSAREYIQGDLHGQNPPLPGYAGAWRRQQGSNARVRSGNLEFGTLIGNPPNVAAVAERTRVVRDLDTSLAGPLGNYVDGGGDIGTSANGDPLYMSVLMRHASPATGEYFGLEMRRQNDAGGSPADTFPINVRLDTDNHYKLWLNAGRPRSTSAPMTT